MSGVAYDPELQAELEAHGVDILRRDGKIVVTGVENPATYNAALHFALSYGLPYDFDGRTVTLRRPD